MTYAEINQDGAATKCCKKSTTLFNLSSSEIVENESTALDQFTYTEAFFSSKNDERDIALGYRPCVTNDETVTREQANVQSAKKPNRRRSSIRLLSVD